MKRAEVRERVFSLCVLIVLALATITARMAG